MSTFDPIAVQELLTADRLSSYRTAVGGDVRRAVDLYDWNSEIGGAIYEDLGRLEVILRNALDKRLVDMAATRGWREPWYRHKALFAGKHGRQALKDIDRALERATRRGPEVHGKVIAELNFGFWRYLCARSYLTTLWVPALNRAFPGHPEATDARLVREQVEDRLQRLLFLRNRIAHHEPVHQRNLRRDLAALLEVAGWMSDDGRRWIAARSRSAAQIRARPD